MSVGSLFSAHWHRVCDVRPTLASDVLVSRHVYRGRTAYVLYKRATTACHRLDVASFELVSQLTGAVSVGQLWERAIVERDQDAPTQDEWIALLAELYAAELLIVDQRVSEEKLFERRQRYKSTERQQRYLNPLYLRFSLFDPDRFMNGLAPLAEKVFSRRAGLCFLLLILFAAASAFAQWEQLWKELGETAQLSSKTALLLLLIYPLMKLLHEFSHALAAKRVGTEVHESGIALMVMLPLPYVDVSASAVLSDKYDRMLVSSAGILAELACAAIGVIIWTNTQGSLQTVGLMLFMVGGVSTLLFNGNPLLKFDGYYLLADWIEIPNLAARSRRTVLGALRYLVSGSPDSSKRHEDLTERLWLYGYGVSSSVYRTVLVLSIAWVLSERWFILGAVLAIYLVIVVLVLPVRRTVSALFKDPVYRSARSVLLAGLLPLLLVMSALWLPIPNTSVVPGVIWVPEDAVIRVGSECDVVAVFTPPGDSVKKGDALYDCVEPLAQARFHGLIARVDELEVRRAGAAARDPLELKTLDAELVASRAALSDARERIQNTVQKANRDGLFEVVGTSALQGRILSRGDVVGYVIPPVTRTVRMAISEDWIRQFDSSLEVVQLRVDGEEGRASVFDTKIARRIPKATRMVASPALSSDGGGIFEADPSGDGRLLKEAVFDVELVWPEAAGAALVGSHVGVRLVYSSRPLFARLSTIIRQVFLNRVTS